MAYFKATIKNRLGQIEEINIEAESLQSAQAIARKNGNILDIEKTTGLGKWELKMFPEERQMLLLRLSSMLASKLGTSEALTVIIGSFGGRIKKIASRLLKHMEGGSDLVESIEKIGHPHFPVTTIALIKAGSLGGETWKALRDAADFEVEMANVRKGAGKGVLGGVLGFLFAAMVTFASKFYVAPEILSSQFFRMQKEKIDLEFINVLSNMVTGTMIILFTIFITLLMLAVVGRRLFPYKSDAIILKIPFYKDLVLAKENYIVLYGLSVMINSGVSMEKSLRLSADDARKGSLKSDLENAVAAIKVGKPWAKAMSTFHATDIASLSVSADKEQTARSLNALSYQYRSDYKRVVASFGPSMQLLAALYLVLSGVILFGYSILPMLQVAAQGM